MKKVIIFERYYERVIIFVRYYKKSNNICEIL